MFYCVILCYLVYLTLFICWVLCESDWCMRFANGNFPQGTAAYLRVLQLILAIWQCASMDDSTGSSAQRYNCLCSAYNFGQPHLVSPTTWYRHFEEAQTDEEQEWMQNAKFDGLNNSSARCRGTTSHRCNNALLVQKRACEVDAQDTLAPEKWECLGDNSVSNLVLTLVWALFVIITYVTLI